MCTPTNAEVPQNSLLRLAEEKTVLFVGVSYISSFVSFAVVRIDLKPPKKRIIVNNYKKLLFIIGGDGSY